MTSLLSKKTDSCTNKNSSGHHHTKNESSNTAVEDRDCTTEYLDIPTETQQTEKSEGNKIQHTGKVVPHLHINTNTERGDSTGDADHEILSCSSTSSSDDASAEYIKGATTSSSTERFEDQPPTLPSPIHAKRIIHIPSMNDLFARSNSPAIHSATSASSTVGSMSREGSSNGVFFFGPPTPPPLSSSSTTTTTGGHSSPHLPPLPHTPSSSQQQLLRSSSSYSSIGFLSRRSSSGGVGSRKNSFRCVSPTDSSPDLVQRDSPRDALKLKIKNKAFSQSLEEEIEGFHQMHDIDDTNIEDSSEDDDDGDREGEEGRRILEVAAIEQDVMDSTSLTTDMNEN